MADTSPAAAGCQSRNEVRVTSEQVAGSRTGPRASGISGTTTAIGAAGATGAGAAIIHRTRLSAARPTRKPLSLLHQTRHATANAPLARRRCSATCMRYASDRQTHAYALRSPVVPSGSRRVRTRAPLRRVAANHVCMLARALPPRCAHAPAQPPLVGAGPLREGLYGA